MSHPIVDAPTPIADALQAARRRTFDLVAHLGDDDLERQVDPIMSPLVWDLGHIAAYEDLWLVHRFAGEPLLKPQLAARYDAFETPRAVRGDIELLDPPGAREYLAEVRERTLAALADRPPDPVVHEMVIRHELQHTETMRQAMEIGGMLPDGEPDLDPVEGDGGEWVEVPGGRFLMGAGARRVRLRQRAPGPRGRRRGVPHRAPPGHERELDALRGGRRLRAP